MYPPHPNAYAEALTSSVAILGDGASKEIAKGKWGHTGGALIRQDPCPYKRPQRALLSPHHHSCVRAPRKDRVKIEQEQVDTHTRKRALTRNYVRQNLDRGLLTSRAVKKQTPLFKQPSPVTFLEVIAN